MPSFVSTPQNNATDGSQKAQQTTAQGRQKADGNAAKTHLCLNKKGVSAVFILHFTQLAVTLQTEN